MAVLNVSTIERFIGLSTDSKPDSPRAGSTFHELDTGMIFIFNGSDWVQDLSIVYAVYQGFLGMPGES